MHPAVTINEALGTSDSTAQFQMEIFLPAVVGELATRSMSFFIKNYCKRPEQSPVVNLERILLRAQVIVDEAAGRCITNQGMLQQLSMLRDTMYGGFYVLDAFRYRAIGANEDEDRQIMSKPWALSKFSYAKRLFLSSSSTKTSQELEVEQVLDSLRTMILDVSESVMFLATYPRLLRQPYSMHILLEKCMFGRQMEMELVVNFLLHTQPCSGTSLGRFEVLPIVGPGRSGKSTLVAHACNDERVRDHFSQIVFFEDGNFGHEGTAILRDESTSRHDKNGRLLIVFEVVRELNEDLWEWMCSLSTRFTTTGNKIIITSRSDKIRKFGTAQAMTLKPLSHEAYWYFFKVITFGSTNPEMHPKFLHLAMEIARMQSRSLVAANVTARVLKDNFNINYWCNVLEFMKRSVAKLHSMYDEVPDIKIQDVVYGGVKPHGRFKILAWKSQILPYHCYIYTCEIREPQTRVVKRKRSVNNKFVSCG
ncbi:disease resistance protein RGA2 [Brachypodium distachyon]|uniref:NB-ARC domain-containing protein n=1 Tax=Brachypodium distachyon TaxID=15368 RepID=A0A2K2DRB9_BRADI|nr:disease resistance protein RGA2 [Brachypodium distachyon]PNT76820.1 hypothetical protein BRADI_1g53930v3 [Brachypodium distachyon]|eukprot:XP_014752037.1 disease resistance protein RGA2 [Brachypodium distachyon]